MQPAIQALAMSTACSKVCHKDKILINQSDELSPQSRQTEGSTVAVLQHNYYIQL